METKLMPDLAGVSFSAPDVEYLCFSTGLFPLLGSLNVFCNDPSGASDHVETNLYTEMFSCTNLRLGIVKRAPPFAKWYFRSLAHIAVLVYEPKCLKTTLFPKQQYFEWFCRPS